MDIKKHYTIGEMSAMFEMETQTLRYYDSMGLFCPEERDERTRYRYYRFEQIYRLAAIRYLRQMDCPLEQVRDYLQSPDISHTLAQLKKQRATLRERWLDMRASEQALEGKITFIEAELSRRKANPGVSIRAFPQRRYIAIGDEENLYHSELFYVNPTLVFNDAAGKHFAAYIQQDEDSEIYGFREPELLSTIPAGRYLCGYHDGAYTGTDETIARLRREAGPLQLADTCLLLNIIDPFVENDAQKFVTEVQIPIIETK